MGEVKQPEKVRLIVGMISNSLRLFKDTENLLCKEFGQFDEVSKVIDFTYTDYYTKEMGQNLKRKFLSFENLIFPDRISDIKLFTNRIEEKFSNSSKNRQINIDPGYISASKLVLASTKNFYHRIYLNNGIYAEITLSYKNNSFEYFDWTFPDYRTKKYIDFFNKVRKKYMKQIK